MPIPTDTYKISIPTVLPICCPSLLIPIQCPSLQLYIYDAHPYLYLYCLGSSDVISCDDAHHSTPFFLSGPFRDILASKFSEMLYGEYNGHP